MKKLLPLTDYMQLFQICPTKSTKLARAGEKTTTTNSLYAARILLISAVWWPELARVVND